MTKLTTTGNRPDAAYSTPWAVRLARHGQAMGGGGGGGGADGPRITQQWFAGQGGYVFGSLVLLLMLCEVGTVEFGVVVLATWAITIYAITI